MSRAERVKTAPKDELFNEFSTTRAGMLGILGSEQHLQPMTHYPDREAGAVYFISAAETDLARALAAGPQRGRYVLVAKAQDFYAGMTGRLELVDDEAKLDEIWNAVAAAWFEDGRRDPSVRLLRLTLEEAALWGNAGTLTFGFEIARANMQDDHEPDVGHHTVVTFP